MVNFDNPTIQDIESCKAGFFLFMFIIIYCLILQVIEVISNANTLIRYEYWKTNMTLLGNYVMLIHIYMWFKMRQFNRMIGQDGNYVVPQAASEHLINQINTVIYEPYFNLRNITCTICLTEYQP